MSESSTSDQDLSVTDTRRIARIEHLRRMARRRALRARYLPPQLFADPAWDMLIELMTARLTRRRVFVSDLCLASGVPTTTGLRWIERLMDAGLVSRHPDPADRRRVQVTLSEEGAVQFGNWLAAVMQ